MQTDACFLHKPSMVYHTGLLGNNGMVLGKKLERFLKFPLSISNLGYIDHKSFCRTKRTQDDEEQ